MHLKTMKNSNGWFAEAETVGLSFFGRGESKELALWDLSEKISDAFFALEELRDKVGKEVTDEINRDEPS